MNEILESIVKRLNEVLSGIPVVNQLDGKVTQDLKLALAKSRVCALVGVGRITPRVQNADHIVALAEIFVRVFENPFVNRAKTGAKTMMGVAAEASSILKYWKPGGSLSPLVFKEITPVEEANSEFGSVITCDAVFNITTEL